MDIELSQAALDKAYELQANEPSWQNKSLRIYIEGKGCDGFTYGVTFDDQSPDDISRSQDQLTLISDPDSYKFLAGSRVEWVDDERGQGFLVENPQHKSFRGKFYKRKGWQERLLNQEATSAQ